MATNLKVVLIIVVVLLAISYLWHRNTTSEEYDLFVSTLPVLQNRQRKQPKIPTEIVPTILFWQKPWPSFNQLGLERYFYSKEICHPKNSKDYCNIVIDHKNIKWKHIQKMDAIIFSPVLDFTGRWPHRLDEAEDLNNDNYKGWHILKNGRWRKPNQIFAWFQWESPWFHGPNRDDMRQYDDFFNASIIETAICC